MARYTLIDGYLDTVRTEIRWRRDLDDLVAEMEDHLYTAVDHMLTRGHEPDSAQQVTLDRFGDPQYLAAAYASTPTGGIAVPTTFTKGAGLFAFVSAGMWLIAALAHLFMTGAGDDWQIYYLVFSAALVVAGVLGLLTMVGVNRRLGGLGTVGMIGIGIVALGVAASVIAWAIFLWMTVQAIGYLVFGIAVLLRGGAPRVPTVLVSGGLMVGSIAFVIANMLEIGERDSYGDYPLAWFVGTAVGAVLIGVGLIGWGRWLYSEEPIDIESTLIAA